METRWPSLFVHVQRRMYRRRRGDRSRTPRAARWSSPALLSASWVSKPLRLFWRGPAGKTRGEVTRQCFFFHMSRWLVSILNLKKCVQKQWEKQKRKQMKSTVQRLTESAKGDVALSGREADRRTASVVSINTTNLSFKGLLAGSLVNMVNLKRVIVNN